MHFTYFGSTTLGLPSEKAKRLQALLTERYRKIASDPLFEEADSALSYCFSRTRPETGRMTVYLPEGAGEKSPVILFLHGYGGSFLFYQHYLVSLFPDHILVFPAYGDSCSHIPREYLQECLAEVSSETGWKLPRPVLMGISAGGYGGFREYARNPRGYLGLVSIAAPPPSGIVSQVQKGSRVRLVAGGEEGFVTDGRFAKAVRQLEERGVEVRSRVLPGEDHFFLLSSEKTTSEVLSAWDAELRKPVR
jgi:pimeloyl-ACP methyl ester carboxylesterase